eukprot:gene4211-8385_t
MSKRKATVLEDGDYQQDVDDEFENLTENDQDLEDDEADDDDPKSTIYEAGIITKIEMESFMCHQKFTIELGRKVNFITGQNGSGKSAIVAAIQLCLGATARNTGRGSSLGKLIKEGCEGPAIVRVTLLNEGEDAYKKEIYGNRIVIERKILKRGGGGYRLLNNKLE